MVKRLLTGILFALLSSTVAAQANYPSKPIRFVVPYPPGGFTDILARLIGQKLTQSMGQPVVVENRGGGGSTIGSDIVAKSAPDGYTILMVGPDLAINESLFSKLPYSAVRDFAPVSMAAWGPLVLVVHSSVPAKSVQELVAFAKSQPGQINYASGGNGTGSHLTMELFKTTAGINMVHIPYKGNGPAVNDLIGGQVSVMFLQMAVAKPYITAGNLRALAIPSPRRSSAMPELPIFAEAGFPGFDVAPWFGVVAPAKTPDTIVSKLSAEIGKVMRLPDVKRKLSEQGAEPVGNTPKEFSAFIAAEIPRWAKVVKESHARLD
jgi:tripartite-type tricarboxylate transporter receptor subunit TctC